AGGAALVQDPDEALNSDMPRLARDLVGADYVLPLAQLAPALARLAQQPAGREGGPSMTDPLDHMPDVVTKDMSDQARGHRRGQSGPLRGGRAAGGAVREPDPATPSEPPHRPPDAARSRTDSECGLRLVLRRDYPALRASGSRPAPRRGTGKQFIARRRGGD